MSDSDSDEETAASAAHVINEMTGVLERQRTSGCGIPPPIASDRGAQRRRVGAVLCTVPFAAREQEFT